MKSTTLLRTLFCTALFAAACSANAQVSADEMEVRKNWSLFSEYFKNGDYRSAIPFGWKVEKLAPARFKTLYQKLGDSYYQLYSEAEGDLKKAYADSIVSVYDLGIKNQPEQAGYLQLRKGFALETYFEGRELEAIDADEKGLKIDFDGAEFFYIDHLGMLYKKMETPENGFRVRAIELYRRFLDREPDNEDALNRLRKLVEDPRQLIDIALQKLKTDPENRTYLWETARAYKDAEDHCGGIQYIIKLTKKSPDSETYMTELGSMYQRCAAGLGNFSERNARFNDAINAYQRALKINPDVRETVLNIAVCYREMKNYSSARTYAQRAAAKDRNWGRPYIEIAQIYEAAVQTCVLTVRGGWDDLKFVDKVVYRLAQEYYVKAKSIDPQVSVEAGTRARHLDSLVPTKEDYFFNRSEINDGKIVIADGCYDWIGESITVPSKFQ